MNLFLRVNGCFTSLFSTRKKYAAVLACCFLTLNFQLNAQVTVGASASDLASTLTGSGITVSSPTLTCASQGSAKFTGISTSLPFSNGVVLTTGKATDAFGPSSTTISVSTGTPGDATLNTLEPGIPTFDACVLEFDFVPTGITFNMSYVFGSEEYSNYVCSLYNDPFGIFISGGTEYPTATNLSLVPGTTIPVCINSVNCGASACCSLSTCNALGTGSPFCAYYVNNSTGTTIAYYGLTAELTAQATVTPCQTYHLKIGIEDIIDEIHDSGVFIAAGSSGSTPGTITGTKTLCIGGTSTLSSTATGGTWSSSNTATATVDYSSGVVTGIAAGTSTITYFPSGGCTYITAIVTVNAIAAISGTSSLCGAGATTTLTDVSGSGTWISGTTSVATVGASTGVVTSVASGTSIITFTLASTGCKQTKIVTVNPLPAIFATSALCVGFSETLSDASGTGTWSSSNAAIATIGLSSGILTGVTSGTCTITFTLPSGCTRTAIATINPQPAVITGSAIVCISSNITLSDALGGGTWNSSNTSIATVAASTGVVTPVTTGTSVISYTSSAGCIATKIITVNAMPDTIGNPGPVCTGFGEYLTCSSSGGTWSSSLPGIASINTLGAVTGVSAGTAVISYTIAGCSSMTIITVNPSPVGITGITAMCVGSTTTLSDATTGGVWVCYDGTVASVSSTGVLTAIGGGTATVFYILSSDGCFAGTTVIVHPVPDSIAGDSTVCTANITALTDATPGGSWSSGSPAIATVDGVGNVHGVASGTVTITYGFGSGCSVTKVLTVNPSPAVITGTTTLCTGDISTLTDATGGGTWTSSNPPAAIIGSTTGVVTTITTGLTEISYTIPNGCFVSALVVVYPGPSVITGNTSLCTGSTSTLYDSVAGGEWTSNASGVVSITGVSSSSGVITGVTAGSAIITYSLPTGCGIATVEVNVTSNPVPLPITGTLSVCVGLTTSLADATLGGTWSSTTSGIATINTSGVATGVSPGTDTIKYTLSTGCDIAALLAVNPVPGNITGSHTVCIGSTATLSDPDPGGTWSSGSTTIATVDPATGIVTGAHNGTTTITYTIGSCFTSYTITVNILPKGITGTNKICLGATTTLSDATASGTWSGSSSVGTISTDGVVTSLSAGTVVITYTSPVGCSVHDTVTVNPLPASITGTSATVCIGQTTTLTDASAGGTWSSSPTSVATVDPVTGIVTGVTTGTATITYTLPTGCSTTVVGTVTAAASITGIDTVCAGATTTLHDAATGGTWSSGSTSTATVGLTNGVVTGVSSGTVHITYTDGEGCLATTIVTVDSLPVIPAISGDTSVCQGSHITLSDAMTGGTWHSSDYSIASIDPSTGVVLGVAPGTVIISYSAVNGCGTSTITKMIHVVISLVVPPITGDIGVCSGTTDTLYDSLAGGTWSSTTTSVATIDPVTGVVTGVATGTTTIIYTATNACGSDGVETTVVVNMPPFITTNFIVACQSIANPANSPTYGTVLPDSVCMLVCDSSVVRYYGNGSYGSAFTWEVIGGTIVHNYGDSIDVFWPMAGLTGHVILFDTVSHCVGEAIACIMVIQKPHANFTVSTTSLCLNDNVVFANHSTADSMSSIVSYNWNFGDGTYSSEANPTHAFTLPNANDTVTLVVTNQCGCKDTFRTVLNISATPGPVITCSSVSCEGQIATYTTADACAYDWTVTGGTIVGSTGTNTILVQWNAVGADGFGYVSLSEPCGPCPDPTTIKVPVVQQHPVISGPGTICVGEEYAYSLPLWPGTQYKWGVLGFPDAVYGMKDDHTAILKFDAPGTYTLHAWYQNRIKLCGANLDTTITVYPHEGIHADTNICQYGTGHYKFFDPSVTGNWYLMEVSTGNVIDSGAGNGYSYTFNTPGVYIITATGSFCANPVTVVVNPSPGAIDTVTGADIVCLNRIYAYSAGNDVAGTTYSWQAIGGTVTPASGSAQISVIWTSTDTKQLIVSRMSRTTPYCTGLPKIVNIQQEIINPDVTGDVAPCANAYRTYNANYSRAEVYDWFILPNTAGSVTTGNHGQVARVLWNNTATALPAAVVVRVHKCDSLITDTLNVVVQPDPAVTITASADTACPKTPVLFTAAAGGASYIWNFGDGTKKITLTDTVSHAFPANTTLALMSYPVTVTVAPDYSNTCPISGNAGITVKITPGPSAFLIAKADQICPPYVDTLTAVVSDSVGGLTYAWYADGALAAGITDSILQTDTLGSFYYAVTDSNGCTALSNVLHITHKPNCDDMGSGPAPICAFAITNTVSCNTISLTAAVPTTGSWTAATPPLTPIPTGVPAVTATYNVPGVYWFTFDGTTPACAAIHDTIMADTIGIVAAYGYSIKCAGSGFDSVFLMDQSASLPSWAITSGAIGWFNGGTSLGTGATLAISMPAGASYTITEIVTGTKPGGTFSCTALNTITAPVPPVAAFTDTLSPSCDQVPINFYPVATAGIVSYSWDFGDSAGVLLPNAARTYTWPVGGLSPAPFPVTLTITDTIGCIATSSATIQVYENTLDIGFYVTDNTVCSDAAPVTLTYIPNTGTPTPVSYLWNDGETISSINVNTSGAYWVTVIDNHQCQQTRPAPVFQVKILQSPQATITGLQNYCIGDAVKLNGYAGAGVTYQWLRNGVDDGAAGTINDAGLTAGDYNYVLTVTNTDPLTGVSCSNTSDTFKVHVYPMPDAPAITGPTVLDCNSYHLQLTASEPVPGTYNWSNGVYGPVNDIYAGGGYRIWFTDMNGCISQASTDVPVSPDVFFGWFPSGCYNICKGQLPLKLFGPADYYFNHWAWLDNTAVVSSGSGEMHPYSITENGTYQWTLDNGLCSKTSDQMSVSVSDCPQCSKTPMQATIDCTPDDPASYHVTLVVHNETATNAYTLGTDIGPLTPFEGTFSAIGVYTLSLTFTTLDLFLPLPDSVSFDLSMLAHDGTVCYQSIRVPLPNCPDWVAERGTGSTNGNSGMKTEISNALLVFPNPTSGDANISYDYGKDGYNERSLIIYDAMGRKVQTKSVQDVHGNWSLNMGQWTPGIYIIIMEADGKTLQTQRVVITH